ncbi:MAG: hypothetical protein AAGD09_22540 [Cyanobacteria bacterium P01_F01_bin.56]
MPPVLSRSMAAVVFATGLTATVGVIQAAPGYAQEEVIQEVLPVSTSVLAAIQEAPFSEVFAVTTVNGEVGYGIKDKDFDPRYDLVGFYSLWADVPEQGLFQTAVMYCILDPDLEGAELESLTLLDGETPLVTLDEKVIATDTQEFEVAPQQTVTTYADPYYSPYWGDAYYGLGGSTYTTTYVPAIDCSLGAARFDLLPVQAEIAQLPSTTLNVELVFSNGQTEMWRLGQGSVEAIKTLPSLQ